MSKAVFSQPTADRLREIYSYDPAAGRLVPKDPKGSRRKALIQGGHATAGAYLYVKVDGARIYAHRAAALLVLGHDLPTGWVVDHINGDGRDNRAANLRPCPRGANSLNIRRRNGAPVGIRPARSGFRAEIHFAGRVAWRGTFVTQQAASTARAAALARILEPYPTLAAILGIRAAPRVSTAAQILAGSDPGTTSSGRAR